VSEIQLPVYFQMIATVFAWSSWC